MKTRPKIDPKRQQKSDRSLHRFLDHFGSIWDAKLGPCWGYVGAMLATFSEKVTPGRSLGAAVGRSGANGRRGTPFLAPRGEGVPNLGSPSRWGTPFLTDFESRLGAKLLPSWGIWDNDFWIWPGGMREAIE